MAEKTGDVLVTGLAFPEGLRWHRNHLWFSDIATRRVCRWAAAGGTEILAELLDAPSGLGFLPDSTLVIVSMYDHKLLRLQDGQISVHADLSGIGQLAPADFLNDMVMDDQGVAYVGTRTPTQDPTKPGPPRDLLVRISPSGEVEVAADRLQSTNGGVLINNRLIMAETYGHRLLTFDRLPDGGLTNRRTFADVTPAFPDGMCADAEGGIWFASPYTREFLRVDSSGAVTDTISPSSGIPVSCAIGGVTGRTLFLACADERALKQVVRLRHESQTDPEQVGTGNIQAVEVKVPAA